MHRGSIPDQEKIRRQAIENAANKGTDQLRSSYSRGGADRPPSTAKIAAGFTFCMLGTSKGLGRAAAGPPAGVGVAAVPGRGFL